jgi:hypothetical protein
MTAFRILDQDPVYLDTQGNLLIGGTLQFYVTGSDTPADVYGDPGLTVNNGSSVTIGSDGRATVDIWGNQAYRVRLYAADGTLVWERDPVEIAGGASQSIPTPVANQFLTSPDGTNLAWAAVLQVPDPTGESGKILGTDGTNILWQAAPTTPKPAIVVTDNSFKAGDGTSGDPIYFVQMGSTSAPASGSHTTSVSVTFPTAYASTPFVIVIPTTTSAATDSYFVIPSVTGKSPSNFTANFNTNSSDGSNGNIVNTVAFDWIAMGIVNS